MTFELHCYTITAKPARHMARFSEDYRQEALELWRNSGRSAAKVAAEPGIRVPLLYRWKEKVGWLGRAWAYPILRSCVQFW